MKSKRTSKLPAPPPVACSDLLSIRHKRLWVGVWINCARAEVFRFEDKTVSEATTIAMHEHRIDAFWRRYKYDRKLRASKHPMAKMLRQKLGLKNKICPEAFSIDGLFDEVPVWVRMLPIEKMVQEGIIEDPAILGEGMVAAARVSTHYRYAATKTALPEAWRKDA